MQVSKKLFHNLIAGVNPTAAEKRERRTNLTAAGKGRGESPQHEAQLEFTNLVLRLYRLRGIAGLNFRQSINLEAQPITLLGGLLND